MEWQNGSSTKSLEDVGKQLLSDLKSPEEQEIIQTVMDKYFCRLAKGVVAPDFTLMNDKEQPVSLSSLKGKIVYIDFWGIGCAPCMMEFKKTPALHAKYEAFKNQIEYVYVCIGSNTNDNWKKYLTKFNIQGHNLTAPYGENSPIAAYDNNAVPLYVLIDKEGKIVKYDAPRPSELLLDQPNILDELLKK